MLFILLLSLFHPYHVSVCDVNYSGTTKSIQIAQNVSADDLERAIQNESDPLFILPEKPTEQSQRVVGQYLREHLAIEVNGKTRVLTYLGYEMEGHVLWCYLEIGNVEVLNELKMTSTLLIGEVKEQVNKVNVKGGEVLKSYKLTSQYKTLIFKM